MRHAAPSRMADRRAGMAKVSSNASLKAKAVIEIAKMLAEIPIKTKAKIVAQIALNKLGRNPLQISTCQKPLAIKPCRNLLCLTRNRKIATQIIAIVIKTLLAEPIATPIPTLAARIEAADAAGKRNILPEYPLPF